MRFAIIAAGEGSRLAGEGILQPKPLVGLGDECLIDRLLRIFMDNGATEIAVICNEQASLVQRHLEEIAHGGLQGRRIPLRLVVRSTPSSMHSLYELSALLEGEPFILTTVDTVFREEEFSRYAEDFRLLTNGCGEVADGLMGVTAYVDDEKPLYVDVDERRLVRGFYDTPAYLSEKNGRKAAECYVSAGIYGLSSRSLDTLRKCIARGEQRMRNFQRALIADGLELQAWTFSKVLDIDHAADIVKAEEFLKTEN